MKFATASEHRDFFRKHHLIEFENLLLPEQASQLSNGIENALCERLKVTFEKLSTTSQEKLFFVGRDLWRENAVLKKTILRSSFGEIASELIEERPVRIAYDQFFPKKPIYTYQANGKFQDLLHSKHTLHEISSLQGILCGLMLCVSAETAGEALPSSLFSQTAGNGVFFHPDFLIDFSTLPAQNSYLMIVYCRGTTVYCLQKEDLHTHEFKKFGYSFGDKLTDVINPVIFR